MSDKIKEYISAQPLERQTILSGIHSVILEEDKTVTAEVEPMMGKELIMYKDRGMMKYGLGSVKKFMTLHVLPIYSSKTLHSKYETLLPKAIFQKGCINFENAENMPLGILRELMAECSRIDLVKIREDYLKQKKTKNKTKS